MTIIYATILGLKIRHTNIKAQKINSFILKTLKIILANFWVEDKLGRAQYFQNPVLLTDISVKVILKMLFLILSNANI